MFMDRKIYIIKNLILPGLIFGFNIIQILKKSRKANVDIDKLFTKFI